MPSEKETLVPIKNHAYSTILGSQGWAEVDYSTCYDHIYNKSLSCVEHTQTNRDRAVTGFLGYASIF